MTTHPGCEFAGPDPLEEHLQAGRRLLGMTDAEKDALAAELGQTRTEYDEELRHMARAWQNLEGLSSEEAAEFDRLIAAL